MPIRLRRPKTNHRVSSHVLTTAEAAERLGVSRFTLEMMVKEGRIIPSRTPGGHFRFTIDQLDKAKP